MVTLFISGETISLAIVHLLIRYIIPYSCFIGVWRVSSQVSRILARNLGA